MYERQQRYTLVSVQTARVLQFRLGDRNCTMDVSLVMFKADGTRRDFPIKKPRTLLGRASVCDLRISLAIISRKHCRILIEDDAISVEDVASSSGTFVNSHRIQKATMHAGDELMVGPVIFTLQVNGQPPQIAPVRPGVQKSDASSTDDKERPPSADPSLPLKSSDSIVLANSDTSDDELDDPIRALDALASEEDDDIDDLFTSRQDVSQPRDE